MSASETRPAWQTPLQWPRIPAYSPEAALPGERVLKAAFVFALLSVTVLDRFGLRVSDLYAAHPALPAMYALATVLVFAGAAELNARSAVHYILAGAAGGLSYLINANFGASAYVSMDSWLLFMVVYAPLMISIREAAASPALVLWVARTFIGFSLFVAVAGIAQFFVQFVFNPPWLFDPALLIPRAIRGFDTWASVNPAGDFLKSNGFFLREPSFFSLQMALGILMELSYLRRKWVMAILGLGLVLSYSGSGLLVLGIALLFPFGRRSALQLSAAVLVAAIVFLALGEALNLTYTANRVEEVSSSRSSAYCRFVDPVVVTWQDIDRNGWAALVGHGPGTLHKIHKTCETTFAKVPFEYGLLGTLALGLLMLGALARRTVPIRVRAALGVQWLTQPYLLGPESVLMTYLLCSLWPDGEPAADPLKSGR